MTPPTERKELRDRINKRFSKTMEYLRQSELREPPLK